MSRSARKYAAVAAITLGVSLISGAGAASASSSDDEIGTAAVATTVRVIENDKSGKAIAIKGASTAHGALAIQYTYAGTTGRSNDIMVKEWANYQVSNWVRLKPLHTYSSDGNVHNDKCLAVKGASNASGTSIVNATCTYDSTDNDVWYAETKIIESNGAIRLREQYRNRKSGLCLVVKGAATTNGAELIQYACNGTTNSLWLDTSL